MNDADPVPKPGDSPGPEQPAEGASGRDSMISLVLSGGSRQEVAAAKVRKHDFRQSAFLAPSEVRWLRLRHEQFARSLTARMSLYLRMEFALAIEKLHILAYQQLMGSLPSPAQISLFKAEPLKGVCLVVLPARLGLALVDRLLGGSGGFPETSRDLTEIETALLEQTIQIVLNEWCTNWQEVQELKPTVVGHENNSRFLQTTGADTPMLSLVLQARFNEDSEQLQMVFPYYTVEPFVRHLNPFSGPVQELPPAHVRWNPQMNEVPVALTARCEGLKVTARQMSRLQAGDTLMLSRETAGEVRVCLGGVPKFAGRLGTCGRKWAVELSALAHP